MVANRPEEGSANNNAARNHGEGQSRNLWGATPDSVAKEMAQAFQDLARGEQAATLIEANLTTLERKLDAILAAYEVDDAATTRDQDSTSKKPMNDQQTAEKTNGTPGEPSSKE